MVWVCWSFELFLKGSFVLINFNAFAFFSLILGSFYFSSTSWDESYLFTSKIWGFDGEFSIYYFLTTEADRTYGAYTFLVSTCYFT